MKVLYVEDEAYLAEAIIHLLKKQDIVADWKSDGESGLDAALNHSYDAIILDVMLPKLSGIDILKTIRSRGIKTPVIILSALSEVKDKVRGLDYGADDYLAKPFKTAELTARLHAITRRPPLVDENTLTFGDLVFDQTNRTLNGEDLTDKEAEIFKLLVKTPNSAVSKQYILNYVWGVDQYFEENYVEVYISYLRKKISKVSDKVKIKTIRGLGYKIVNV